MGQPGSGFPFHGFRQASWKNNKAYITKQHNDPKTVWFGMVWHRLPATMVSPSSQKSHPSGTCDAARRNYHEKLGTTSPSQSRDAKKQPAIAAPCGVKIVALLSLLCGRKALQSRFLVFFVSSTCNFLHWLYIISYLSFVRPCTACCNIESYIIACHSSFHLCRLLAIQMTLGQLSAA